MMWTAQARMATGHHRPCNALMSMTVPVPERIRIITQKPLAMSLKRINKLAHCSRHEQECVFFMAVCSTLGICLLCASLR